MWWLLFGAAFAGNKGWNPSPYFVPRGNLRAISVNGQTSAQLLLGAEAGIRYSDPKGPLFGRTRLSAEAIYGFLGSWGADARIGSFIGPHFGIFRYQLGPDVWYNGYGSPSARDYYLPWSAGVSVPNQVTLQFVKEFGLVGIASPGWAFLDERQGGGLGPFHEVTLLGAAQIRLKGPGLMIGYQKSWNAAGTQEGIVLSASL